MTNWSGEWLFDTQLLIYALDSKSPFFKQATTLFSQLPSSKFIPTIAQQNILEAENVFIKKYKLEVKVVLETVRNLVSVYEFNIIIPKPTTYNLFHKLFLQKPKGKALFDYYLASTMLDNGINKILTVNTKDFKDIKNIEAVNPFK